MKMIGIDGGATKVAGAQVIRLDNHTFDLVEPVKEIQYKTHKSYIQDFEPLALSDQVESKDMSELESRQAEVYIECIVNILDDLINDENVKVFIAMPGIKTLDKRGIKLMAIGPRIPNLCDEIEKRLTLKNKIQQIESDADMCAWGEEFGKKGEFRNIENAYYIGGGTGTADGLKLGGKLISFDDASEWIAKTWELMIEDKKLGGLRVKDEGGGCSEFQYDLSFDVWDNDDMVFWADSEEEHNKFPIIVDKRTILYLAGSQINYHDGLMGSGFAVENPNANSTCGCGESFSI